MLVLSRRIGEEIVIADRVRVRVAAVRGNRVQLAIAAPTSVPIHRGEIQRQRRELTSGRGLAVGSAEELFERQVHDAPTANPGSRKRSPRQGACAAGA